MSQSASRSNLKFLLDENVKKRVGAFLHSRGFDVITAPKSLAHGRLAVVSKSEKRILRWIRKIRAICTNLRFDAIFVTNDADFEDFTIYPKEKIFSIVMLRIPQDRPDSFVNSFSKLLDKKKSVEDFEGQLITLKEDGFGVSPIPSEKRIKSKGADIFMYFTK